MKKLIIGAILGFALSMVTTAYGADTAKNDLKADSIEIGTQAGYIYPTTVEGKKYFSIASPDKVQLSGKEVWVNGKVKVNGWDQVTNGDKTLQQEIDELREAIKELQTKQSTNK